MSNTNDDILIRKGNSFLNSADNRVFEDVALKDSTSVALTNGVSSDKGMSKDAKGAKSFIASCSDTIKLFDASTCSLVGNLENGHERDIKCLAGKDSN